MFAMEEIKTIHIEGILLFFFALAIVTEYICNVVWGVCQNYATVSIILSASQSSTGDRHYPQFHAVYTVQSDKSELKRVVKTSWDRNHDNRLSLMNVNACILIRYDKVWQFLLLVYINTYLAILFKLINHDPKIHWYFL